MDIRQETVARRFLALSVRQGSPQCLPLVDVDLRCGGRRPHLTQNLLLGAALLVGYGLYQGIFRAVGKAFAADFVPEHLRASGVGGYSTTVGLLRGKRRCVSSGELGFLEVREDGVGRGFWFGDAVGCVRHRLKMNRIEADTWTMA